MAAKDLLIADLEHFGESLWRNEEVGEKRFSFFVTLVTAVAAGLVALATTETKLPPDLFRKIAGIAMIALFVIGLVSYLRMLHRNRVTDEYHRTLKYIREMYRGPDSELASYKVPRHQKTFSGKWLKGGYAETIGMIDGLLLMGFLHVVFVPIEFAVVLGVVLAVVLWVYACMGRKKEDETVRHEAQRWNEQRRSVCSLTY